MFEGRKPAYNSSSFQGGIIACGSHSSGTNTSEFFEKTQYFRSGNRIAHNPSKPTWFSIPSHHKKRSALPLKAMQRLKDAYFYPKKMLKDIQNHEVRQVRTEFRNVILDMLSVMIYHMDDKTLRVGQERNGKWHDLSISDIAEKMGISLGRAKRAFRCIVRKGYVSSQRVKTSLCANKHVSFSSIKKLAPKLFVALGFAWEHIMRLKAYRREKKSNKEKSDEISRSHVIHNFIHESLLMASSKKTSAKNIVDTLPVPDKPHIANHYLSKIKQMLSSK